jgi:sigma-B regulation protein RsbU (phosphoserine phosphatase)
MALPAGRRPVLGLLVNTFFDGYEEAIWRSVVNAAEEFDVDLLYFLLGAPASPETDDLFDLVHPDNVDGVIAVAGSLTWAIGPALVAARIGRLGELPVVSLSEQVGRSRIAVDNAGGILQLVDHLAREHGRRRIGFLAGPANVADAAARLEGYREGLARAGLPFDPGLVLEGDFTRPSVPQAFRKLDEHPAHLDALVAANDSMALVALEELRRRGLTVPGDVAVCGFDDIADSASVDTPLTTIRQPLREMAHEAVRQVLALIRGESVPANTIFPARLVVRQTCGCARLGGRVPSIGQAVDPADARSLAAALEREFAEFGRRIGVASWAADLSGALRDDLAGSRPGALLAELERLLSRGLERLTEPDEWLRALRTLISWAREGLSPEARERVARLHADGNALVASMSSSTQLARRARSEQQARAFRWLLQPFPFAEDQFVSRLLEQVESLGMRSCFIARFLDSRREQAALVAHFDLDGIAALEESPAIFTPGRLLPGRFVGRRRRAHAVLPVSSPDGLIGFALCELCRMSLSGYEIMMHELSMVLSVNALMAEVREQQQHLMESARQAGMAEVAVGALHNVGNLLNSVSVSAEEIREAAAAVGSDGLSRLSALLSEQAGDLPAFFARDERARHLPAYLAGLAETLGRELSRIRSEAGELTERTGLVRDSIRVLQDVARGGSGWPVRETVDLATVIRAALEIQRGTIERHRVQVREELGPLPPIATQRARLVHVLVNLVKNAAEAMRSVPEERRVLVLSGGRREDGKIRLDLRDAGEGIAPENLERIFAYGFTTKPDGNGFGLHTCANYMKQMGGSLSVASDGPGTGATFTLVIDPGGGRG